MRIEGYFTPYPIFHGLSGKPLPMTDHPLVVTRSVSNMSGQISGLLHKKMNSRSWIVTDEVQFILSLLLRNDESNRSLHILGPHICNVIGDIYNVFAPVWDETATPEQTLQYNGHMKRMMEYLDTRLDVLEHKFLVFICNISTTHWVAVVVVNPFLVSEEYLHGKYKGGTVLGEEDFVGWCVLNSNE